jgi:cytochrome c biogenesis protein CcmG/thiol:disulfide interchange protein DsbE
MNARHTPLAMMALLVVALGFALLRPKAPAPDLNGKAPGFALMQLDGAPISWKPAPGKITLVNFFASWCVPCLAEHPHMRALADSGVDIIGIAWNDRAPALEAWLAKHGNPYRAVYLDGGQAAIAMGIRGVPESFLIAADGSIAMHLRGAITPPQSAAILEKITSLRGGDAPAAAR